MRRIPLAFLFLGICASGGPVPLTPTERKLSIDSFEYVWKTIRDSHWDPQLGGLDWSAVHDELRPKMEKAETTEQTREILRDMIGRLHQSHFSIIPSEVYGDVRQPREGADGTAGFDVRVISGKAVVTSVESESPAASEGVRSGWEITAIEGAELSPILHRVAETYRNSTLRDLYLARAVLTRLDGALSKKVRVEFLDGAGQPLFIDIARTPPRGEPAQFGYAPLMHAWIDTRQLESGIGYVAFNLFMDPARMMPRFEEAVKSCLTCDGMVVDLRGNTGGIAFMAMGMAGFFVDRQNQILGTMHMRQSSLQFFINPRLPFYGGPLAILVDGLSASTSEILAGGLKDLHRARIFGTRTAGAALPSVIEKLPNGDGFQYARASYVSEGGKPLEGIGVVPDVEAAPTREALLAGRDPALDAALQWIHTRKKGNKNEK